MKYVYILQSVASPDRYYSGMTNDLKARIRKHNTGEVSHTSKFVPWKLNTYVAFSDEVKPLCLSAILNQLPVVRSPKRDYKQEASLYNPLSNFVLFFCRSFGVGGLYPPQARGPGLRRGGSFLKARKSASESQPVRFLRPAAILPITAPYSDFLKINGRRYSDYRSFIPAGFASCSPHHDGQEEEKAGSGIAAIGRSCPVAVLGNGKKLLPAGMAIPHGISENIVVLADSGFAYDTALQLASMAFHESHALLQYSADSHRSRTSSH
jgi:predicted GIY-YIG superfamily endonuclease